MLISNLHNITLHECKRTALYNNCDVISEDSSDLNRAGTNIISKPKLLFRSTNDKVINESTWAISVKICLE